MAKLDEKLKDQIEKAFDYRGHVTLELADGKSVEGFLYNRDFEAGIVDVFPKDSDDSLRFDVTKIRSVALTGKDHAESYGDYLKRTKPNP